LHPSRTIISHLDKASMNLSQLVNPNVTFSKTTLEDITARYTVKHKDSTATVNKTPQSVRTTLSALGHAYARIHGQRPGDDYGNLTWLTLENLKQPSKYANARPLFVGAAHPNASAAMSVPVEVTTLRKNLENFRSVLYSAAQHLKTLDMSDADRKSLTKKYNDAYVEFGELSGTLMSDELDKVKTHQPSQRQQSKWVPWTDVTRLTKSVLEYLDGILASPPASMGVMQNKKMQRALQLVLYVLIPPLRNNYTNLRLITPDQETLDILKESNSPNYVVVDSGGFVTLVINKFKTDARSAEVDYDPTTDFRINHPKTQRFELSRPQPILTKFGFEPRRLADTLLEYHNLQVTLLGDRNPHKLFFCEIPKEGPVRPVSGDGMSTRLARVTERLTGLGGGTAVSLGAQMLRTIFVTWFDGKRPTAAEREEIAKWMMHHPGTQLRHYTKSKRTLTGEGGKKKRRKAVKVSDLCI
jgi:hypothetical protein